MKIAYGSQMREMDAKTSSEYLIPSIVLMENAAAAILDRCLEKATPETRFLCVCGGGNNGGDGFAVARLLFIRGYSVAILFIGKEEKLKGDALINFKADEKIGIEIVKEDKTMEMLEKSDIVIDAVFGTGFSGVPREPQASVIKAMNESGKYIISVDIASGVDSQNGHASEFSVNADETVTFEMAKIGNILYPGAEKCGKLTVAKISIPQAVSESVDVRIEALTDSEAKKLLPARKKRSNKGTFGKLFVFAGSKNMFGAAFLCGKAAYETGCGLVYSCVVNENLERIQISLPEAVAKPVVSKNGKFCAESLDTEDLKNADIIAVGPGIGRGKDVTEFVEKLLLEAEAPCLIDADGLNAIENREILKNMKCMPVITPHPGEMSRLTGKSIREILDDTINVAENFAKEYNCVVVLKDARTIIASPDGHVYINMTGNESMAKGGSGDVLSGIITALMCQKMDAFHAAALGAYIHGRSGEIASEKRGSYSVLASDLCENVGNAIKSISL
ncbi:MAG: NAD(P)H-hydrate dehydratase [Clostridia bacterium]|jgi:NAD(P)H-hydrate epimerase|nr:NAD(P)H-hydrate dehydratase [Clostridia bacterium]